jgi:hypothetical protein
LPRNANTWINQPNSAEFSNAFFQNVLQRRRVTDFGLEEVDLIKLDCEGAEYLIVSELSALGLMDRIGWIRGEWHSRKDNLLLANLLGQTHAYNIDLNHPHSVGMFVAHRV